MSPGVRLGALALGTLLSRSALTEQVVSLAGVGKLIVASGLNRACVWWRA